MHSSDVCQVCPTGLPRECNSCPTGLPRECGSCPTGLSGDQTPPQTPPQPPLIVDFDHKLLIACQKGCANEIHNVLTQYEKKKNQVHYCWYHLPFFELGFNGHQKCTEQILRHKHILFTNSYFWKSIIQGAACSNRIDFVTWIINDLTQYGGVSSFCLKETIETAFYFFAFCGNKQNINALLENIKTNKYLPLNTLDWECLFKGAAQSKMASRGKIVMDFYEQHKSLININVVEKFFHVVCEEGWASLLGMFKKINNEAVRSRLTKGMIYMMDGLINKNKESEIPKYVRVALWLINEIDITVQICGEGFFRLGRPDYYWIHSEVFRHALDPYSMFPHLLDHGVSIKKLMNRKYLLYPRSVKLRTIIYALQQWMPKLLIKKCICEFISHC